jgi:hypothetical protein
MLDAAYFREQAARCRRLARDSDDKTSAALLEIEMEYALKAAELAILEANNRG